EPAVGRSMTTSSQDSATPSSIPAPHSTTTTARGFALTAIITGFAGIAVSLIYLAVFLVFVVVALAAGTSGY
ncbi:hypothetical protein, partial [Rathayibacter sp. AY1H3]|uniref:hypothetical protein n=1 Tax=Rathayibacter sp. AY1H3 TaxID=2080567 RepID=UPI001CA57FB8